MSRNSSGLTPNDLMIESYQLIYMSRNSSGLTPNSVCFLMVGGIYMSRNSSGLTPQYGNSVCFFRST